MMTNFVKFKTKLQLQLMLPQMIQYPVARTIQLTVMLISGYAKRHKIFYLCETKLAEIEKQRLTNRDNGLIANPPILIRTPPDGFDNFLPSDCPHPRHQSFA